MRCRHFWRYRNTLQFWFGERLIHVDTVERRFCFTCAEKIAANA